MQYSHLRLILSDRPGSKGSKILTLPVELFNQLLGAALRAKGTVDETFYLAIYSDIREAINNRLLSSASEHYYTTGYFEGRLPCKLLVDEKYYLEENPDVVEAIRKGVIKNAQEHFEYAGFREGRLPYKVFSLF
jgi:hypothetical protein